MQFLVSETGSKLVGSSSGSTMQFIRLQHQDEMQLKQRQLPKKPESIKTAPAAPLSIQEKLTQQTIEKPVLSMPEIPTIAFNNRPFLGGFNTTNENSELLPLVRVEPNYPRKAARSGTEGWVEVQFTVLKDGSVSAAKVVKAEPRRIFNREALKAISKWRFNPKMIDGKAVAQTATQRIEFTLLK